MALDRWNPFMSLREAMERLQENLIAPSSPFDAFGQRSFPLDLAESENQFLLRAPLPGIKPEDVEITLQGDLLTITGTMQAEQEQQDKQWLIREQRSGTFQRTVRLPTPVNADQAVARVADGILTLTLPKTEAARTQHIKLSNQPASQTQAQAFDTTPGRTDEQVREPFTSNNVEEASRDSFPASDAPSWTSQPQ